MGTNLICVPWGKLHYTTHFEAYELDISEEELKRAPSFRADRDFDWGDLSQEAALHRYYGILPFCLLGRVLKRRFALFRGAAPDAGTLVVVTGFLRSDFETRRTRIC
jgi:hypothetical protein